MTQTVKCLPAMWETRVQSLGREDPLEKEMATHSSTLACPWTDAWATSFTHSLRKNLITESLWGTKVNTDSLMLANVQAVFILHYHLIQFFLTLCWHQDLNEDETLQLAPGSHISFNLQISYHLFSSSPWQFGYEETWPFVLESLTHSGLGIQIFILHISV